MFERIQDRFDDADIQKKLVGAVLAVFLVGMVALGWNALNLLQIRASVFNVYDRYDELNVLKETEILFRELEALEKDYVLQDPADFSEAAELIGFQDDTVTTLTDILTELRDAATDDGIVALVDTMTDRLAEQDALFDAIVALMDTDPAAARALSYASSDPRIAGIYEVLFNEVETVRRPQLENDYQATDDLLERVTLIMGITLTVFAITGGIIVLSMINVVRRIVRPVAVIAEIAQQVEREQPTDLTRLDLYANQGDEIGQLTRVFRHMASQVTARVRTLKSQVAELQIVIDQTKLQQQVSEITDNDYFNTLQSKAKALRRTGTEPAVVPPDDQGASG